MSDNDPSLVVTGERMAVVATATGTVDNVIMATSDFPAGDGFELVPSETARVGDHWDGASFTTPPPPPPPPMDADQLRLYAAHVRYRREIAGISVGGAEIATDRESQALITGALLRVMRGTESITWKAQQGFVELSASQIEAIADAVAAHVQDAFGREGTADAGIADGSITTPAQIDGLFA